MSENDDAIAARCRRLAWPLTVLIILAVPMWLVLAWLSLFLIGMAGGGSFHPVTFADYFLNIITISIVALAMPFAGLIVGLAGRWRKHPRMMGAGIWILAIWLLVPLGFYGYQKIEASMRANPGNWADRDYKISPEDRRAYRMLRYGRVLSITLPNPRTLFPQAAPDARLPARAVAEIGVVDMKGVSATADSDCGGVLRGFDFTEETRKPQSNPMEFYNLFGLAAGEGRYLMAPGRQWIAVCMTRTPVCETFFINKGWVSAFAVAKADLCRAPDMNRRFVALMTKWLR